MPQKILGEQKAFFIRFFPRPSPFHRIVRYFTIKMRPSWGRVILKEMYLWVSYCSQPQEGGYWWKSTGSSLKLYRALYARKQSPWLPFLKHWKYHLLRCFSVLSVSSPIFFSFFLPNAFSCPLLVWAASLIKVSSYFLMQLPLQLIYLFILVF